MKNFLFFLWLVFFMIMTTAYANGSDNQQDKDKNAPTEKIEEEVKVKTLVLQGNRAFAGKRYDEAIGLYKQAIEIDSNSEDAHYNSAIAYERKGMIDSAIGSYKKLLTIYLISV